MRKVQSFNVIAELPASLEPLKTIASNYWWSWHHSARNLFIRISKEGFVKAKRNPIRVLDSLSAEEINALSKDKGFIAQIDEVMQLFTKYKQTRSWWSNTAESAKHAEIAYFSAEFGLHESLPVYSGGLGVLAGDHLKAASDLGIPIIAVGLLYYEGYFSQYLNKDGWQQESYPQIQISRLPLKPALGPDGKQIFVTVDIRGTKVIAKAWQVDVGLTKLYLLDTNHDENDPAHRIITSRLYGGDVHVRILQEIVLGVGGMRMLKALGVNPDVCHMNEGHSAFLALEQIRILIKEHNLNFEEALLAVKSGNLFTTHTMVPAGNDVFTADLIEKYFAGYAEELGVNIEMVLRLGRVNPNDHSEPFSMTVLALRTSQGINAVSELHGFVSRKLWQNIWPEVPLDESPIKHITNGIHTPTWTSRDMAELYDRYLGPNWRNHTSQPETWSSVNDIPDEELWRIICRSRSSLVTFCRERIKDQLTRRGAGRVEIENASQALDPQALTIGFARRFASYKRAALILRDIDRLIALVQNSQFPVQFIFSGKAHPADQPGKEIIAKIIHAAHRPELKGRLVFIEDYDMAVARKLVQGVDVWLNNPRRPLEASGTSGMKVSANAGLNVSVLDGWWCEAFNGENGWSIGQGEEYEDTNYQDHIESRSIYDLLEREVIPTFYNRSQNDIPKEWMELVKHSIQSITPAFSACRMVSDYATKFYLPLTDLKRNSHSQNYSNIRSTLSQLAKFRKYWPEIKILDVETNSHDQLALGRPLPVKVTAQLGHLTPDEVAVQVRVGVLDVTQHLHQSNIVRLTEVTQAKEAGTFTFSGNLSADRAGSYGFSVRIVPIVDGVPEVHQPGLLTWWQ